MKRIVIVLAAVLALASCQTAPTIEEYRLNFLSQAKKPVTVLAVSRDSAQVFSCVLKDARGRIFVVQHEAFSSLRPGMVIQ